MMRTLIIPVFAVLALGLVGCSGSSSVGDGRECIEVPADAMASIAEGANDNPIMPIAAGAVTSKARGDMTVIAMSFTDEREPDTVLTGTWGLGGTLDAGPYTGPWVAIDGFAQSWTVYPSEVNGEKFSATEDGVEEAKACLAALSE